MDKIRGVIDRFGSSSRSCKAVHPAARQRRGRIRSGACGIRVDSPVVLLRYGCRIGNSLRGSHNLPDKKLPAERRTVPADGSCRPGDSISPDCQLRSPPASARSRSSNRYPPTAVPCSAVERRSAASRFRRSSRAGLVPERSGCRSAGAVRRGCRFVRFSYMVRFSYLSVCGVFGLPFIPRGTATEDRRRGCSRCWD